jgi:hypothetical protein
MATPLNPADGESACDGGRIQQGIEVRLPGRASHYFWTDRRQEVLGSLAAAGFDVADEEQSIQRP